MLFPQSSYKEKCYFLKVIFRFYAFVESADICTEIITVTPVPQQRYEYEDTVLPFS